MTIGFLRFLRCLHNRYILFASLAKLIRHAYDTCCWKHSIERASQSLNSLIKINYIKIYAPQNPEHHLLLNRTPDCQPAITGPEICYQQYLYTTRRLVNCKNQLCPKAQTNTNLELPDSQADVCAMVSLHKTVCDMVLHIPFPY